MGIAERKERQRVEREGRIVATARLIAVREGWDAVTVRRLAQEIEYSQPVLYSHFENRDAIVAAVAIQGFRELTTALHDAGRNASDPHDAAETVALAYLAFARVHQALYEAMFTLPIRFRFAEAGAGAGPELKAAFAALSAIVPPSRQDVELVTETFWASLHGLAELERSGRIRTSARAHRVALVVGGLLESS